MYIFKNINKEKHTNYIKQAEDLNIFNLFYEGLCLGCFYDNTLIGIIEYNPNASTKNWKLKNIYTNNKIVKIGLLHIKNEYRGNGIGTLLLTQLFKRLSNGNILVLKSDHTEEHRKFYLKNGFIEENEWVFVKLKKLG